MKSLRILLFSLACSLSLSAETPLLLSQAVDKLIADDEHWAYTRVTRPLTRDGKPSDSVTIEQFDPSLPYGHQWTLVKLNGHAPSRAEVQSWEASKARMTKARGERTLGDILDLDHARVQSESPSSVAYVVPILREASRRFPADKFQVMMTVDKARSVLTSFSVQQREKFRVAGVASVDSVQVDGRLASVDGRFAPVLVWARGNGRGRILGFIPVSMGREFSYADFRRVKPYRERFGVQIGDIKALHF